MLSFHKYHLTIVYSFCLFGTCLLGDNLLEFPNNSRLKKAIIDNGTHALVGLFSGLFITTFFEGKILSIHMKLAVATCVIVSSLIDLDHFIAAKSFRLKVSFIVYLIIQYFNNF